jgi:hypothetical protein
VAFSSLPVSNLLLRHLVGTLVRAILARVPRALFLLARPARIWVTHVAFIALTRLAILAARVLVGVTIAHCALLASLVTIFTIATWKHQISKTNTEMG